MYLDMEPGLNQLCMLQPPLFVCISSSLVGKEELWLPQVVGLPTAADIFAPMIFGILAGVLWPRTITLL
jgi:hypothetical protein